MYRQRTQVSYVFFSGLRIGRTEVTRIPLVILRVRLQVEAQVALQVLRPATAVRTVLHLWNLTEELHCIRVHIISYYI